MGGIVLNGDIGKIKYIGTGYTGENGGTVLTIPNKIPAVNSMMLVFVRNYNGSLEVYPPYAYLIFTRRSGWSSTPIGTPHNVASTSIKNSIYSINFKSTEYAQAWLYQVAYD